MANLNSLPHGKDFKKFTLLTEEEMKEKGLDKPAGDEWVPDPENIYD